MTSHRNEADMSHLHRGLRFPRSGQDEWFPGNLCWVSSYLKLQQKIQTFFNTCLRHIYKIQWQEKTRNEDLWERAGQEPVAKQILQKKWGWIGQALRIPASSTTRQALTWNLQGKRKRGRPRWSRTAATRDQLDWKEQSSQEQSAMGW